MIRQKIIVLGIAATLFAGLEETQAQTSKRVHQHTVWFTNGLAKVQPNASPGTATSIAIFAARNEFESFQVHVQAGSAPIALSVSVTDFVNNADGSKIPSNPNVAVFREGYINVTTPSDLNGITGQVPDPLIPVQDAYFHQARNAFPVTVPSSQTRSAWVDVFVPASAEAGYYTASVNVMDGTSLLSTLPVHLKVWNFTLPSTSTLKSTFGMTFGSLGYSAYGSYAGFANYPGSGGDAATGLDLIHAAVATFFLDHRVTLAPVVAPTTPAGQWSGFDSIYGPLLLGTEQTILPHARQTSEQYPNNLRPANTTDLLDWTSHFASLGASSGLFGYLCDEPPAGCSWNDVYNYGTAAHAAAPTFPLLVTTSIALATQNNVLDEIDILAPVVDHVQPMNAPSQRPAYNTWLQQSGKQLWWYQSCDQHGSCTNGTPGPASSTWASYMVDASPVRNRIFQWLAYLYGIQGELYYGVETWGDNPWDHLYFAGGNGDGALYYPGTVDKIGGTVPVPVASMRLKLIRDGMEDFEYLTALSQSGQSTFAANVSSGFIQNAYTFNNDPGALSSARTAMGEQLHQLSIDVTNRVSVTATALTYSHSGKLFTGTVTVANIGASTIAAPLQLMLNGISSGVTLTNATGTTIGGSPFITSNTSLAAGASVKFTVQFSDSSNTPPTYTPQVLSGIL